MRQFGWHFAKLPHIDPLPKALNRAFPCGMARYRPQPHRNHRHSSPKGPSRAAVWRLPQNNAGTLWELFIGAPAFRPRPTAFPVVPGVLQVWEVLLERDLLGLSKEVRTSSIRTTGQELEANTNHETDLWSITTDGGDQFD